MSQLEIFQPRNLSPIIDDDQRLELISSKASQVEKQGAEYRENIFTEKVMRTLRDLSPIGALSLALVSSMEAKTEPPQTINRLIIDGIFVAYGLMISGGSEVGRRMARSKAQTIAQETIELTAQTPSIPAPNWARRHLETS